MNRAAVPILILRAILGAAVCLSLSCDSPSGQGAQRKGATAAAPTPSVESAARPPVSSSSTGQLAQAVATDPEGPIIDWNYEGPSIGIRSAGPTYHVTAEFAIEEWDNGKAPEALQRWTLLCSYPQTRERPATECTLTRLMVTGLPKVGERPTRGFLGMVFYPAVSTNDHST